MEPRDEHIARQKHLNNQFCCRFYRTRSLAVNFLQV